MKKLNSLFTSTHIFTAALVTALYSPATFADWSANISAVSDYTFNGLSQTQNDPALQGGVDKAFDNGTYVGTWASNVDFGDDTKLEWDDYVGR